MVATHQWSMEFDFVDLFDLLHNNQGRHLCMRMNQQMQSLDCMCQEGKLFLDFVRLNQHNDLEMHLCMKIDLCLVDRFP